MRVEVVCRSCASGQPATGSAAASASGPAPVPRRSAAPVQPTQRVSPLTHPQRQAPSTGRFGRKQLIGAALLVLVGSASIGIAVALKVRGRKKAVAAAHNPTPAQKGTPDGGALRKKGFRIRTITDGTESTDQDPAPVGLQAVLEGKWTHPCVGPFRELPPNESTRFGAYRKREVYKNQYCGSGHCGNDLGNKVGLPIVAVRDGVLERVVRSPTEVEGKWLKIRHPGGLHSYYMHLDQIAPGLEIGTQVTRGMHIGTLGTTGIKRSEPHLHFMISFDADPAIQKELFIDPEPIVREADLVELPEIPDWARPGQ